MKTKLSKLTKSQLEQLFFHFFDCCCLCRDFIDYVPRKELVFRICSECTKTEIEEYLTDNNI